MGIMDFRKTPDAGLPARLQDTALNATYVPKWKATTAYLAGDKVLSPAGEVVSAIANFTSGASYSAANWNVSAGQGLPKWKANTAYTAGDAVLSPNGDVVTAKATFTSGASYSAANWNLSSSYATPASVGPLVAAAIASDATPANAAASAVGAAVTNLKIRQILEYGLYGVVPTAVPLTVHSGTPTYLSGNAKFGTTGLAGGLLANTSIDNMMDAGGANTTFESWFKPADTSLRVLFGHPGWWWLGIEAGGVHLNYKNSGGATVDLTGGSGITTGAWHHLALVFNASKVPTVYVDGAALATGTAVFGTIPNGNADPFIIGGLVNGASGYDWTGAIDEVRISTVARYTAAFTPPAAEFVPDTSTAFLSHFIDASGSSYAAGTGYETRPAGSNVRIEWVGPVTPPEMQINDTWIEVPA